VDRIRHIPDPGAGRRLPMGCGTLRSLLVKLQHRSLAA